MKIVLALLRATFTALRREQKSQFEVPSNNLYYAAVASVFMLDPAVAGFAAGLVIIVMFFPLSADPMRLVPRSREASWPLTAGERRALRALSPWLNPMTWIIAAFALWRRVSMGVAGLVGGLFLIAFVRPARWRGRSRSILRFVPRFPGSLGQLIRKDVRHLLITLDFYCALIPAAAALGYRLAGLLPREAFLPGTCMVLLPISTCGQTLFGLDGRTGRTRYRLLPITGWQILLAKDIAFMTLCIALTAALSPLTGLAGALAALSFARRVAVHEDRPQRRWRLQSGTSFAPAITQIIGMCAAASFEHYKGPLTLIPCAAIWLLSLWWGGRELDRAVAG